MYRWLAQGVHPGPQVDQRSHPGRRTAKARKRHRQASSRNRPSPQSSESWHPADRSRAARTPHRNRSLPRCSRFRVLAAAPSSRPTTHLVGARRLDSCREFFAHSIALRFARLVRIAQSRDLFAINRTLRACHIGHSYNSVIRFCGARFRTSDQPPLNRSSDSDAERPPRQQRGDPTSSNLNRCGQRDARTHSQAASRSDDCSSPPLCRRGQIPAQPDATNHRRRHMKTASIEDLRHHQATETRCRRRQFEHCSFDHRVDPAVGDRRRHRRLIFRTDPREAVVGVAAESS